ncbi:MAG: hypothetical protein V4689_03985 [Verrucomicrobiota bacterium]
MISKRTNPRMIIGWLLIACAISAFVLAFRETDQPASLPDVFASPSREPFAEDATLASFTPEKRERKSPAETAIDAVASRRLEDQFSAGELGAIDHTLASLAETHQLGLVAGVLKKWCRDGGMEVAQWCLVYSGGSDPELSLTLGAEALSNPSDAIREMAAARLEAATGHRFTTTGDARAWLANRPKP